MPFYNDRGAHLVELVALGGANPQSTEQTEAIEMEVEPDTEAKARSECRQGRSILPKNS